MPRAPAVAAFRGSSPRAPLAPAARLPHCLVNPSRLPAVRRALTLIELLLVLALLVIVASITVPTLTNSFANVRLRRAADQLISGWSEARKLAIETGEAYQFTYTPETGRYRVGPWTAEMLQPSSRAGSAGGTASTAAPPSAASTARRPAAARNSPAGEAPSGGEASAELPTDIVFHAGQLAAEEPITQQRRIDSLVARGGDESTPILFFPDGSSSEAAVTLTNGAGQYVRVSLRSLTGVGRASDVMTAEELQRWDARSR